jgi:SAM-dependent methyltransferase
MPQKLEEALFITTCSATARRALVQQARRDVSRKVHLVYHGLDVGNFPFFPGNDTREKNLVLSIGRLTAQKGFPDLIEAVAILVARGVSCRAVIVGEGEERPNIERLIASKGLQGRILLPGSVTLEEVKKYYRRAWLFALPCVDTNGGNRDGIPNVLMEAMAMGLPVVTTTNSGQPELIDSGVNGLLVRPRSPIELADGMMTLFSDDTLWRRLQSAARRRIVEDFDNRKTIEPLIHLLHQNVTSNQVVNGTPISGSNQPGHARRRLKKLYQVSPTLRMRSVVKASLMRALAPYLSALPAGPLLDVGAKDAPYRESIGARNYVTLDISASARPDVCCDLHDIAVRAGSFDAVVAIEVLEHLYDPQRAVNEIHRVLGEGGRVVASTRFICCYHPDPNDYYRFTSDALRRLFSNFSQVDVVPHGNGLQALWHIVNNDYRRSRVVLNLLNPIIARINFSSNAFPLGFVVTAVK